MFGQNKINMTAIRPTSKIALKISCLQACGNDLEKAERLYDFVAKDMELPDFDAPQAQPLKIPTLWRCCRGFAPKSA